MQTQIADMVDAIAVERGNGWVPSEMEFRMSPSSLDAICLEAAKTSTALLRGADRPSNFMGIPINESDQFQGWELVAKQPR